MSIQRSVLKEAGSVGDNPIRLDTEKAEQIIEALNTDLTDAYAPYHQLHKHHRNVEGAKHPRIHGFLQEVYEEVEEAADEITERLQSISGASRASIPALSEVATVEPEDEGIYDIRTLLSNDLEMYGDITEDYCEYIGLIAGLGDHTTVYMLREQLIEVEERAHAIDHYLEDDTLVQ